MNVLKAQGLCKSFNGHEVLRDVSLELPERGVTALTGPSGCGKTTLLHILAGLLKPDSGTVELASGARLSMVFQEDRLLEWATAEQNAAIVVRAASRRARTERALRALDSVGLLVTARQSVSEMSGGMKRRVALARALAAEGQLLLLDEPFQGLDDATKEAVMDTLRRTARDTSILLVTHDDREIQALDAHKWDLQYRPPEV